MSADNPPIEVGWKGSQKRAIDGLGEMLADPEGYTDQYWQESIHDVLTSVCFSTHSEQKESYTEPINIFLLVLNIDKKTGSFSNFSSISGTGSALTYGMRLVAIAEITYLSDTSTISFVKCV